MYLGADYSDLAGADLDSLRQWEKIVKAHSGVVVRWPFPEDDYYNQPAARFSTVTYQMLINAKRLPATGIAQYSADRRYVYVLAPPDLLGGNFVTYPLGDDFADWITFVKSLGGVATTWPFNTGIYGRYFKFSAARYPAATYAAGANAGQIDTTQPTQTTADSSYVYVLAPDSVQKAAPQTMSLWQSLQNTVFTRGDQAANAVGLPSLTSIENMLKGGLGLVAVAAIVGGAILLRRRR
jgi:hypothetical protein